MFIYKVKVRCYDSQKTTAASTIVENWCMPTTISQNESRRFRVKFAPNSSSATALETCRQFSTVIAPLVPVKEMEMGAAACRKGTTRTTSDKTGSFSSGLDGDSQFLGCGEDFDSSQQQVVPETQNNTESRQPNMTAGTGPILIPDESSLIPIPDIGKVLLTPTLKFFFF